MSEQLLQQELMKTNKLLALLLVKGSSQTNAILTLSSVGFKPKEIAEFLGTNSHLVSVALHQAKKSKRNKK